MLAGELQKLNTWTACFESWMVPNRYQKRIRDVSEKSLQLLREKNACTIRDMAFADSSLDGLRAVFKKLPKAVRHEKLFQELSKELTAISLGTTAKVLDDNPGFEEFAREGRIDRDLVYYKEQIEVMPKENTHVISIKFNGKMTNWSEVQKLLPAKPIVHPHRAWNYGPQGAQRRNLYKWEVGHPLTPTNIFQGNAPWGNRYIFEFCVYYTPEGPKINGDHAWIHLGTPDGKSYEPGLYRPEKRGIVETYYLPFRRQRGYLQERDISVTWKKEAGEKIIRVGYEITGSEFESMMSRIQAYNSNDNKTFHNSDESCVLFAKEIAGLAGISPSSGVSSIRALSKTRFFQAGWTGKVVRVVTKIFDALPWALQRVVEVPFVFAMNVITGVFAGGIVVDKSVRKNPRCRQDRFYQSPFDFFKPSKNIIHHPHFFAKDYLEPLKRKRVAAAKGLSREEAAKVMYPKFQVER